MKADVPAVRIIHETNPEKYFPAVLLLADEQRIDLRGTHRYSVVKEWARSWRKDRKPFSRRTRAAFGDLLLRLKLPFIRGEIIILGFAPWDWRILLYALLADRNTVVYHTSWPKWQAQAMTPRQYGAITPWLEKFWRRFLQHPNVTVVAVLDVTRTQLESDSVDVAVIPHAVPEVFFASGNPRTSTRLRLLFVGELAPKKGIPQLLDLMRHVQDEPVTLTIVGDGELRNVCTEAANSSSTVSYLGPIADRAELAGIMAQHDVLVLLSQREGAWEELFGIVIAEASAAGLGVIGTTHVGPSSILGPLASRALFDESDTDGPRQLIVRLAQDRSALLEFREGHRDLATAYRIDRVALDWERLIVSLWRRQPDKAAS